MLEEISEFYKKTKNRKEDIQKGTSNNEVPIAFTHIFHKEYPRFPSIKLPNILPDKKTLDYALKNRKSTREFSKKAMRLEDIAKILNSCRLIKKENEFERRTYPSAGARFPIELYPLFFNIKEHKKGAYHYNSLKNILELILERDLANVTEEIVSPHITNPSAAIIMTSVIPRSEVKYTHKAYPFSLLEAGHMGQNISLECARSNIGCCAIGGYVDNTIKEILDLTENEIPIYAIALGNIR
jgi:SagB-type dehydrogenase family enzyme